MHTHVGEQYVKMCMPIDSLMLDQGLIMDKADVETSSIAVNQTHILTYRKRKTGQRFWKF